MRKGKYRDPLRMFWTDEWKYNRTIEHWLYHLGYRKWPQGYANREWALAQRELLCRAVDKLVKEKQFIPSEAVSLKSMINAADEESVYMALILIQQKKPKKFKTTKQNSI